MNKASGTAAEAFSAQWIEAWNSHNVEDILSHYDDDVVFLSPVAAQRVGNGRVVGKQALRNYWSAGLSVLFLMSAILLVGGLLLLQVGTAGGEQVSSPSIQG